MRVRLLLLAASCVALNSISRHDTGSSSATASPGVDFTLWEITKRLVQQDSLAVHWVPLGAWPLWLLLLPASFALDGVYIVGWIFTQVVSSLRAAGAPVGVPAVQTGEVEPSWVRPHCLVHNVG